jgi:aspartyl-tRNA(Asn)/glutamyl-tRNA(Gln) amidotransferase subunit A
MGRYDGAGITPLAPSLDTPGPMARDMAALLKLDAALRSGDIEQTGTELPRLVTLPREQLGPLDPEIRVMFDRALRELRLAGYQIDQRPLHAWQEVRILFRTHGTLVELEAPNVLAQLTDITSAWIDPVIRQRLEVAATLTPADARRIREARAILQSAIVDQLDGALLLIPTLPAPPPRKKDVLADTQAFATENARALSLTMPGAYLDMPSLALPCGARPGHSMTVAGASGDDDRVLWVGQQLETLLSPLRSKVLA